MAFWPRNDKKKSSVKGSQKSRWKPSAEHKRAYPYLEPGLIGAATRTNECKFLSNPLLDNTDSNEGQLKYGKHIQVFPPTRPAPTTQPHTSVKRHAEQGANFLRTFLPDVDITSDLIREQLAEDTAASRDLETFDPRLGNAVVVHDSPSHENEAFVLFASGQTSCDLSICAVVHKSVSQVDLYPQANAFYAFQTPIQQLLTWWTSGAGRIAARTVGSLNILKLDEEDDDTLAIQHLATLTSSETERESPVDMKVLSTSMGLLTIGHKGGLYECTIANGSKTISKLYEPPDAVTKRQTTSELWRIARDKHWYGSFILSTRHLLHVDHRSRSNVQLFSMDTEKHVFTSIEDSYQENLVQACSTDRLWWFDPRYPGKPLLAYAHRREFDQYLTATTVTDIGDRPLTFLTTRNNALVTVYDVNRSSEGLIQLNQSPYMLDASNLYEKDVGRRFFVKGGHLATVRVSERGALSYATIQASNDSSEPALSVHKTEGIDQMEAAAMEMKDDIDMYSGSDYMEVDIREVYTGVALFKEHFEEQKEMEDMNHKVLEKMIDTFPYVMRNEEMPLEHMLTTYDIAFRAGDEPERTKRADFLTETALNTPKAHEALTRGKFHPLSVKAPWNLSLQPTMKRLDPGFRAEPQEMMENLRKFDILHDDDTPQSIIDLEENARRQLVVDLTLSRHIFSETRFAEPKEVDDALETMTEALTIADELPPVEFGYLRPMENKTAYRDEVGEVIPQEAVDAPMSVRSLLKEWDSGPPDGYVYRDPYGVSQGEERASSSFSRPVNAVTQLREFVVQSQRPPTLASSTMPTAPRVPGTVPPSIASTQVPRVQMQSQPLPKQLASLTQGGSQPTNLGRLDESSQETVVPMVSTQIVPGPFGARPNIVKKKPAKKRVGGF